MTLFDTATPVASTPDFSALGYELVATRDLKCLQSTAYTLRHAQTQAEVISIQNNDPNNYLSVAVYTPASDNSGIAHVEEHIRCSGRAELNIADAVATFHHTGLYTDVNASTWANVTAYQIGSRYPEPFERARDVYLGGVFDRNLEQDRIHFLRERGFLIQKDGKWIFNGVVSNEMQDGIDDCVARYEYQRARALYQGTADGWFLGGDPENIREISFEDRLRFGESCYHPSNSLTVHWGNRPLEDILTSHSDLVGGFNYQEPPSRDQQATARWDGRIIECPFEADLATEPMNRFSYHWRLPRTLDPVERRATRMVCRLLDNFEHSPLKRDLTNLGCVPSYAGVAFDSPGLDTVLCFDFVDGSADVLRGLPDLLTRSLQKIVAEGLDPRLIESMVDNETVAATSRRSSAYCGESIVDNMVLAWGDGRDPLEQTDLTAVLEHIGRYPADSPYWTELLEHHLLSNTERLGVLGIPDSTELAARSDRESAWIEAQLESTDSSTFVAQKTEVERATAEQEENQSSSWITRFPRETVPTEFHIASPERYELGCLPIEFYRCDQGERPQIRLSLSLDGLPDEYIPYLPLLSKYLQEAGTASESLYDFSIRRYHSVAGLGVFSQFSHHRDMGGSGNLVISVNCRSNGAEGAVGLVEDVLFRSDFSCNRADYLKSLVRDRSIELEDDKYVNVIRYLLSSHRAIYSPGYERQGMIHGHGQYQFVRKLAEEVQVSQTDLLVKFEEALSIITRTGAVNVALIGDDGFREQIAPSLTGLSAKFSGRTLAQSDGGGCHLERGSVGFGLSPSKVFYPGFSVDLQDLSIDNPMVSAITAKILAAHYLHSQFVIGEKAYGADCQYDALNRNIVMIVWDAPSLSRSFEIFSGVGEWLSSGQLTREQLDQAVLQLLNKLVASSGQASDIVRGIDRRMLGYDDATYLGHIQQLPQVTLDEVVACGEEITRVMAQPHLTKTAVFGDPDEMRGVTDSFGRELRIEPGLN